jgi:hypothetical protein
MWPPLFKEGQHFNGEWSTDNEEWFINHIEHILSGNASALHSQKQWKSQGLCSDRFKGARSKHKSCFIDYIPEPLGLIQPHGH